MSAEIKLIVFDWDGTLMDSAARIVSCFRAAAEDQGLAAPDDNVIRDVIGLAMPEAIAALFPGMDMNAGRMAFTDRYRHHYLDANPTPTALFVGVTEMLDQLDAAGYMMAVATSKGRGGLDRVLHETGLRDRFCVSRTADEAFSKPHPAMLLDILEYLGVSANEAVMVGDTEYDLMMARNAQVAGVGVCGGAHERPRLLACGPVVCLERTTDLPEWLSLQRRNFSGDKIFP